MPKNKFAPAARELVLQLPALHPEQQLILDNARRFNVLCCGRRFGKTTMALRLLGEAVLQGLPCAYFAPTYKMLAEVWREFQNLYQPIIAEKIEDEHYVRCLTGGRVDFWSLENGDAARGRAYKLLVVDEAAMVPNLMEIWELVLRPTLMDYMGGAWFLSTPKGRNGFHKLHLLGRDDLSPDWVSWTRSTYDNPYIQTAEIDAMREGQSELAFKQEVMAEFLEDSGTVFRHLEETCVLEPSTPDAHVGHSVVMGVDWGKQNDFSVFSVGCATCAKEVFIDRFNEIDYFVQRQRLQSLALRWKAKAIELELNSVGEPLFEELQRLGLPVWGFKTTVSSKTPLIESFALALERGDIQLLRYPTGRAELEAFERRINPMTNRATYSAPQDMHDDTVMARAIMFKRLQSLQIRERYKLREAWKPPGYAAKGF